MKTKFVRDGNNRIVGSITTGFTGSYDTQVRDEQNRLLGTSSYGKTRTADGKFVSTNTGDPGLLFRRK